MTKAKYTTIAPIISEYNNTYQFKTPFGDVSIAPKPDFLADEDIVNHLGTSQKMGLKETEIVFITECEAEALGEPDPQWRGETIRSKQDVAFEKILICNLALWIAKPTTLASDLLLHIRDDGQHRFTQQSSTIDPFHPHDEDRNNSHTDESCEIATRVNLAILGIERKHSPWVAVRTLMDALMSLSLETRFIYLWVALEALYGIDSEIRYRISNRIAFFIGQDKQDAKKLASEMKVSYGLRSGIVHGLRIGDSKKENLMKILYDTETVLRKSLLKILLDNELIAVFNSESRRNQYLDEIIFA